MPPKHKPTSLPRQTPPAQPPTAKPNWFLSVLVIASITVVVLGIVLFKDKNGSAVTLATPQSGGQAAVSSSGAVAGPLKPGSPSDQLNQALAASQPVLVFMHSTNCQSCIDMMKVVDQVYPEFAGQVTLVDVDVYDDANVPLMQLLGLRYIPTVVVFDEKGTQSQNVGAMQPEAFRTFLSEHALGG